MKEGPRKTKKEKTDKRRGGFPEAWTVHEGTCGEVTFSAGKNRLTLQV